MEASPRTCSFNLVKAIKKRRFKWLGHILRLQGLRLIKLSTRVQYDQKLTGDLFADLPTEMPYEQVRQIVQNHKHWKQMSTLVGDPQAMKKYLKKYQRLIISELKPNPNPNNFNNIKPIAKPLIKTEQLTKPKLASMA